MHARNFKQLRTLRELIQYYNQYKEHKTQLPGHILLQDVSEAEDQPKFHNKDLDTLKEMLRSELCPRDFEFEWRYTKLIPRGVETLKEVLSSGHCREGLSLGLDKNLRKGEDALDLVRPINGALLSGACPKFLSVRFGDNRLREAGARMLANTVKSGKCPEGFMLDISGNNIKDEGAIAFADALQKAPKRFYLNLSNNSISEKGILALIKALPSAPEGFGIDLALNTISDEVLKLLGAILPNCRKGMRIHFYHKDGFVSQRGGMKGWCSSQATQALLLGLESGNCLELSLPFTMDRAMADTLAQVLSSGKCPKNLEICFFTEDFSYALTALSKAFVSGHSPEGLRVELMCGSDSKNDEGINSLATALVSKKCPPRLQINFNGAEMIKGSLCNLIKAATHANCPENLELLNINVGVFGGGILLDPDKDKDFIDDALTQYHPYGLTITFVSWGRDLAEVEQLQAYVDNLLDQNDAFHQSVKEEALACTTLEQGKRSSHPTRVRDIPSPVLRMCYSYVAPFLQEDKENKNFSNNIQKKFKNWCQFNFDNSIVTRTQTPQESKSAQLNYESLLKKTKS